MYVLLLEVEYEGQSVLGVYASEEDAVAAAESFRSPDGLVVRYWEVGAAPAFDEGRLVWSGYLVGEEE